MTSKGEPDLTAIKGLGALASAGDGAGLIRQMRATLAQTTAIREQARELVGQAKSDDGHVRASYTGPAGLAELNIDPRAMRLPSHQLASRIVQVTAAARADLERQRTELLAASSLTDAPLAAERGEAMLSELSSAYAQSMGDIQTVFEQFRTKRGQ